MLDATKAGGPVNRNQTKQILVTLTASLALFATACSIERNYEGSYGAFDEGTVSENDFYSSTSGELDLRSGFLAGTIGPMTDMQEEAARLTGWQESEWTSLEVSVQNQEGSAMSWLDINGGIFHPVLQPGAAFTFTNGRMNPETDLYVSGVGCAGNSSIGSWSYDEQIEEVTIEVEETADPEVNRLNFTTRIGENESTGFVDVALAQ